MPDEIEVKIEVEASELDAIRKGLSDFGFVVKSTRAFEQNYLFDFSDGQLSQSGCALRLRRYADKSTLTYKGPRKADPLLKIREEIESKVESFQSVQDILLALGLTVVFEYSKHREKLTTQIEGQDVELCIDETPIGCFVEVEASPEMIDRIAEGFGWGADRYLNKNYVDLYRERLETH
jgi:adenylate cyclase class 2